MITIKTTWLHTNVYGYLKISVKPLFYRIVIATNSIRVKRYGCAVFLAHPVFSTRWPAGLRTHWTAMISVLRLLVTRIKWNSSTQYEYCLKHNRVWNKYVGPPYCLAEMYAGRVACCPLVSHGEYANGTDKQTDSGRTSDRYITLSAGRGQGNKIWKNFSRRKTFKSL